MGAPKVKCASCGAKNDAALRRCRVCAVIINMNVPEHGKAAPADMNTLPEQTFFDSGDLNRQMRPKDGLFKGGGEGLGARLAAAKGGGADSSTPGRTSPVTSASVGPPDFSQPDFSQPDFSQPDHGAGHLGHGEPSRPQDFSRDEVFIPQEFSVSTPAVPPLEVEEERFDPDALFRDAPGSF